MDGLDDKGNDDILWEKFQTHFREALQSGSSLPYSLQVQAVEQVDSELSLWKTQLQILDGEITQNSPQTEHVVGSPVEISEVGTKPTPGVQKTRMSKRISSKKKHQDKKPEDEEDSIENIKSSGKLVKKENSTEPEPVQVSEESFPCDQCDKSYSIKQNLTIHMKIHKKGPLMCPFCDKKFKSASSLSTHKKRSHKDSPSKISGCPEDSTKSESLDISQVSQESFPCDSCHKVYNNKHNLKSHKKIHDLGSLPCPFCVKTFKSASGLGSHKARHHKDVDKHYAKDETFNEIDIDHIDSLLDGTASDGSELETEKHLFDSIKTEVDSSMKNNDEEEDEFTALEDMDVLQDEEDENASTPKTRKITDDVGQTSEVHDNSSRKGKRRSSKTKDDKGPFKCSVCSKVYGSKNNWRTHMKMHKTGPLKCSTCDMSFNSKSGLVCHKRRKHNTRIKCAECDHVAPNKRSLNWHVKETHKSPKETDNMPPTKQFLCHMCDAQFHRKAHLQEHLYSHKDEKDVQCPHCDFVTRSEKQRKQHIKRVHMVNDPFVCNICGTSVTSKASLKQHERAHLGERPFQCPDCPFRANSSGNLYNHRKIHKPREHKCRFCYKMFTQKVHLERHLVVHTGLKLFSCPHCSYTCNVYTNLQKHVKIRHNLNPRKVKKRVMRLYGEPEVEEEVDISYEPMDIKTEIINAISQITREEENQNEQYHVVMHEDPESQVPEVAEPQQYQQFIVLDSGLEDNFVIESEMQCEEIIVSEMQVHDGNQVC